MRRRVLRGVVGAGLCVVSVALLVRVVRGDWGSWVAGCVTYMGGLLLIGDAFPSKTAPEDTP
jgi:hypothetical protein